MIKHFPTSDCIKIMRNDSYRCIKKIITPILVKWLSADRERVKLRSTTSGDDELFSASES